jgi:hypothetical protein
MHLLLLIDQGAIVVPQPPVLRARDRLPPNGAFARRAESFASGAGFLDARYRGPTLFRYSPTRMAAG